MVVKEFNNKVSYNIMQTEFSIKKIIFKLDYALNLLIPKLQNWTRECP